MSTSVSVSETFVSLQGEGLLSGTPSWFCRFSVCNLRCRWCDTPYSSWAPEGTTWTLDQLLADARASDVKHAVLTGGEPMVIPQVDELAAALVGAGFHVTIETAGTVDRPNCPFDLMSVSPKLANSTPVDDPRDPSGVWAVRHEARRLDLGVLQAMLTRAGAIGGPGGRESFQFKFVVMSPDDLPEIDAILSRLSGWEPEQVFLMPEGVTTPDPSAVRWVMEVCASRGWRYGHRLHIELFGNTRGT